MIPLETYNIEAIVVEYELKTFNLQCMTFSIYTNHMLEMYIYSMRNQFYLALLLGGVITI